MSHQRRAGRALEWKHAWSTMTGESERRTHAVEMNSRVREVAVRAKGFLDEEEGLLLFKLALDASRLAPCFEVGSYCGKSAIFLAEGCRITGKHVLFSVDHHRGSEEQQPGQEYYDDELFDAELGRVDTFRPFVKNVDEAGLRDWVVPIVSTSERLGSCWPGVRLGLVFVDGGHGEQDVRRDVSVWSARLVSGGYLCVHDLYADPAEGGQAPYRAFEEVRASGGWEHVRQVGSLGVLKCR